jgi:DNA-binding cell septation regulator SpoVG
MLNPKREEGTGVQAFANVGLFKQKVIIRGVRLIDGKNGFFLGWPSRQVDDEYIDVAFITDSKIVDKLTDEIVDLFEKAEEEEERKPRKRGSRRGRDDDEDDEDYDDEDDDNDDEDDDDEEDDDEDSPF